MFTNCHGHGTLANCKCVFLKSKDEILVSSTSRCISWYITNYLLIRKFQNNIKTRFKLIYTRIL